MSLPPTVEDEDDEDEEEEGEGRVTSLPLHASRLQERAGEEDARLLSLPSCSLVNRLAHWARQVETASTLVSKDGVKEAEQVALPAAKPPRGAFGWSGGLCGGVCGGEVVEIGRTWWSLGAATR